MKLSLAILFATALAASAHPMLQNSMWVVCAPDRVRVAVNVSLKEILVTQQMQHNERDVDLAALESAAGKHGDYLLSHLSLHAHGRALAGSVEKITPPVLFAADPEQTFYQYELAYPLAGNAPPETIAFRQDMLREWPYAPGQAWDVSYLVRLKRSDRPDVSTGILRANAAQDFPTGWTAHDAALLPKSNPAVVRALGVGGAVLVVVACVFLVRKLRRR